MNISLKPCFNNPSFTAIFRPELKRPLKLNFNSLSQKHFKKKKMKLIKKITFSVLAIAFVFSSCVSKKEYAKMQTNLEKELATANEQLGKSGAEVNKLMAQLSSCEIEKTKIRVEYASLEKTLTLRQEQMDYFKKQLDDLKTQRDKQMTQVGDLTVLSQSASNNIKETLAQLEKKDKYIQLLQAAKTKADSINLALAVNLKGVLEQGISDKDIDIRVDKTVVFINLSDKMLYQSGSSNLTPKANEVLAKIAKIIESRPELDVMVEGYTDNVPVSTTCLKDNWDLSVMRSTAVVRALQKDYSINPNRLIAAGRGQYNTLGTNDTPEGRAINRRTRIIILPKLNQFYDLLNPALIGQ
jgi:chemotaxis protein MotB